MADRYYVETPIAGPQATLTGSEAHHLLHVMRARPGAEVVVFDGSGAEFLAKIGSLSRSEATLEILERRETSREADARLTLAVALPKGDRQRWLVEKCVELGVAWLVPLVTERGVAQPEGSAIQRLRRSVIEASKQCGRNRLMQVSEGIRWAEFVAQCPADAQRLLAHPGGEPWSVITSPTTGETKTWFAAVGPEGGFSDAEVALAKSQGWRLIDLGRRILRIETAALCLAALVTSGDSPPKG